MPETMTRIPATFGYPSCDGNRSPFHVGVTVAIWLMAGLVTLLFLWIVGDLIYQGTSRLSWSFLVDAPQRAGRTGGIGPILISTVLVLAVSLAIAVPLGTGAAIWLTEFSTTHPRFEWMIRISLDALAGVPSIVFGIFGNAMFCVVLGLGFSILSGGFTLACMILPILIRSVELGLRSVPIDYRLAGAALAVSRTGLIFRVLLPAAAPALAAGLVLGIGRALAETAALIFTSGYVDRTPTSLLDSGRTLSVHVYDLAMNVAGGEPSAYASALVLVSLLLGMNWLAGSLTERLLHRRVSSPS